MRIAWRIWIGPPLLVAGFGSAAVLAQSQPPIESPVNAGVRAGDEAENPRRASDSTPAYTLTPLPPDVRFQRFNVGRTTSDDAAGAGASRRVYSNRLGPSAFDPPRPSGFPAPLIADDIATMASPSCALDRYVFRVSGDPRGDGSGVGPFSVDFALYDACPGAGGEIIAGTDGVTSFPDNGNYEVVFQVPPGDTVAIPNNLYFGLSFSRSFAGVVVGAPAMQGFSEDRFDFEFGPPCDSQLGGFPAFAHASFDLEIFVRDDCPGGTCTAGFCVGGSQPGAACTFDCPAAFPAYKNSKQSGTFFSSLPDSEFFADDVSLGIPVDVANPCNLVAWKVAFTGDRFSVGIVQATLHTGLDSADPENGFVIPATRMTALVSTFGSGAQPPPTVVSKTFDPPIPITQQDLWVVYRATTPTVGAVRTCERAGVGSTQDTIQIFNDLTSEWQPSDLGDNCHSGFYIALTCAGSPPDGACCDTLLPENGVCVGGWNDGAPCARDGLGIGIHQCDCPPGTVECTDGVCVGDAVCRQIPKMNCVEPNPWQQGAVCESVCVGGTNDGAACTRQADCPGGDCPGPFAHPCGTAACCTPDDTCENLTQEACVSLAPPGDTILWLGLSQTFCEDPGFACPFFACVQRRGNCVVAHPEPGCEEPFCCGSVCEIDPWCCLVEWDQICLREEAELCSRLPPNRVCFHPASSVGAMPLAPGDTVVLGNGALSQSIADPPFCCNLEAPDSPGWGPVWFSFEATDTTARIHTCDTLFPIEDTMIQVFRAADPTTPETACNSLEPIACNDDAPGCGGGRLADLCVAGLTPGETYYAVVAGKTENDLGVLTVEFDAPCTAPGDRPANNDCETAQSILEGVTPLDLSNATFDCPGPNPFSCTPRMRNDVWFDWTAPATGRATFTTCEPSLPVQADTVMVVYEGCDCPKQPGDELACDASCFPNCFTASCLTQDVVDGHCYKIRIGGDLGGEPVGNLQVEFLGCPPGTVGFFSPPQNVIDARQPFPPGDPENQQGLDEFVAVIPSGGDNALCWPLGESGPADPPNAIASFTSNGDGTTTIRLDHPIRPGSALSFQYHAWNGTSTVACYAALPGDVTASGTVDLDDVTALVDILKGLTSPTHPGFSDDINRDGTTGPHDLLRLIDLLRAGWLETSLPPPGLCPSTR